MVVLDWLSELNVVEVDEVVDDNVYAETLTRTRN